MKRTYYIAEHTDPSVNKTVIYGYDLDHREAFTITISGRITAKVSTRTSKGSDLTGPCSLFQYLQDFNIPLKQLNAIKEERPF